MPCYRLALDLGTTSLGWSVIRIDEKHLPTAIIRAGVRIFSDGRNPKDGQSLAVTRREARAIRRRRDRLLKRKSRMRALLKEYRLFPKDDAKCKALETLNPYELRARGLDSALTPEEFGRAIFHLNQRRGFKSNRKTDSGDNDDGLLKSAISELRQQLDPDGKNGQPRTIGELLWGRLNSGQTVRARYREKKATGEMGKPKIEKSYDLYFDRQMVEDEFDALWRKQATFNPEICSNEARETLKDCLFFQRRLRPVLPGRCTLNPEDERAPLALPSQQLLRIYQDVNHLRVLDEDLRPHPLSREQRDLVAEALQTRKKVTFAQIKKKLGLPGTVQFSIEDERRKDFPGHLTNALLSKKELFGPRWFDFPLETQDEIVTKLLKTESEAALITWLKGHFEVNEQQALKLALVNLPEGYGRLGYRATNDILAAMRNGVITYDKAVKEAGYQHHSALSHLHQTGECLTKLPYYGEYLQRHVGFGTGDPNDVPEKRFGKIANPTVHIGLNQVRKVVNTLIGHYGLPNEVVVELSRDLKQSREQKIKENLTCSPLA